MNPRRRRVVIPILAGLAVTASLALIPPTAAAATDGCLTTLSTTDFNGDGFDDAAVGDPYATVAGKAQAGAVTILFGDADGRIGEGARKVITQASFGDTPEAGDHFGFDVALARAALNGNCADLLVGVPGEDLSGGVDAGLAYLVRDLPDHEGNPDLDVVALTQAEAGGTIEPGDEFGYAVAITAATQQGTRRLVVGAPGENAGSTADVGAVNVWQVGTTVTGLAELRQGKAAPLGAVVLPGSPQAGDRFGASLAVGAMDLAEKTGPEIAQGLIIGAPGDTVSGQDGAGSVTVVQEGFQSATLISQDSAGVPGSAENGDQFGYSLAFGAGGGSTPRTLAVGAPGEDVGKVADAGSVTLFSNRDERFVPSTAFNQATARVPGSTEAGDRFGSSVSIGRTSLLLVGIPSEDVGSVVNAGAVQPVLLSTGEPVPEFLPAIDENAPGTQLAVGAGHQFGRSVAALSGQSENIVTISSPMSGGGSVYVLSDGPNTAPRSWVPAAGASRFGWSVTN